MRDMSAISSFFCLAPRKNLLVAGSCVALWGVIGCGTQKAVQPTHAEDLSWLYPPSVVDSVRTGGDVGRDEGGGREKRVVRIKPVNVAADTAVAYLTRRNQTVGVKGYLIQVYNGNERQKAEYYKSRLEDKLYDRLGVEDLRVFVRYRQPYYKVRVGYFGTRIEAYEVFLRLRKGFPMITTLSRNDLILH